MLISKASYILLDKQNVKYRFNHFVSFSFCLSVHSFTTRLCEVLVNSAAPSMPPV